MMILLLLVSLLTGVTATSNVTLDDFPEPFLNLSAGNVLWTALLKNCRKPTMACVEKNMYDYLKTTLDDEGDLHVAPFLKIKRNSMDYQISGDSAEEYPEEEPTSGLEAMSRSLHGKGVKFLMTHDLEMQLPEPVFQGSTLKISPRGFEGNGALVKLEVMPKQVAEGRLFKKLKEFISEKLIYALLAILLVIKLLAAKFMFFMPMAVGAVTAKKLLIKVLLFLFPALHHLFKLCAYVPHGAKIHHHKHHISHIHHLAHHPHKHHHHGHGHHGHHDSVEVIHPHAEGPPVLEGPHWHHGGASLHHSIDIEEPHKTYYKPHEQELEYYSGGPHLSHHFINHRQDASQDDNEVQPVQGQRKKPISNRPLTPSEIEAAILKAEKEALLKARLQQERQRIQQENARLQEQLKLALKLQEKLKQHAAVVKARLPVPPSTALQTPAVEQKQTYSAQVKQEVVEKKKKEPTAFETALHQAASITYDPFYSPILEKIDKILVGLGFNDEPCRERLICSMYKNPTKFSPHSNLLSAELSRDSKELQKPTSTNAAVVRFYRYVQAARDGQDQRECLRLYPSCSINTEQ